jgi:hypothetical protein
MDLLGDLPRAAEPVLAMETVPPQSKVGLDAAIRRDSQAGVSGQAWEHR